MTVPINNKRLSEPEIDLLLSMARERKLTLKEIGKVLGISASAVCYQAKKAGIHRCAEELVTKRPVALTAEYLRSILFYDSDTGDFHWRKAFKNRIGKKAGWVDRNGYVHIRISRRKLYLAHRLAWLYVHGRWPRDGLDHKNGIPGDNRIDNLRECTQSQNNYNTRVVNARTSIRKGVCYDPRRRKYRAYIRIDKKWTQLGRFDSVEEAIAARLEAEDRTHGEFARRD